ncbi:hypothetical protein Hdeb2414_s0009g00317101 [Helianthus debilis subsp. tardiflorus]
MFYIPEAYGISYEDVCVKLHVHGNAKGSVAVVVSILIFKNPVSVTGMLGIW